MRSTGFQGRVPTAERECAPAGTPSPLQTWSSQAERGLYGRPPSRLHTAAWACRGAGRPEATATPQRPPCPSVPARPGEQQAHVTRSARSPLSLDTASYSAGSRTAMHWSVRALPAQIAWPRYWRRRGQAGGGLPGTHTKALLRRAAEPLAGTEPPRAILRNHTNGQALRESRPDRSWGRGLRSKRCQV